MKIKNEQYFVDVFKTCCEEAKTKRQNDISPIPGKYVHKVHQEEVVIGEITEIGREKIGIVASAQETLYLFYSFAIPNFYCQATFDHPLDHYPFMLLFELGRQLAIASTHTICGLPLKGHITVFENVDFEFLTFAELDVPLIVAGMETERRIRKEIVQAHHLHILYIQEGHVCAKARTSIKTLPCCVYERMRLKSRKYKVGHIEGIGELPVYNIDMQRRLEAMLFDEK